MPLFHTILGGAAGSGGAAGAGYEIERSLRFNSGDSAYLDKTFSSAGNRRIFTFSAWLKRSTIGGSARNALFNAGTSISGDNDFFGIRFQTADTLNVTTGSTNLITTTRVFRDPSAWYHIVVTGDTTQSSNQFKIYVNGVLDTQGGSLTANTDLAIGNNVVHEIGRTTWSENEYLNGYLADVHFIDGQALEASDFGELDDNNVWQPIEYAGTYGTNGFHLDFSDTSSNAALGDDSSGNNKDWTVNNLVVSSPVYAVSTTTASNGTVSNGTDNPYWIDIVPSNADIDYDAGSAGMTRVHDGNTSTNEVYWVGDQYNTGNVTQARFDLRDFPSITSLRVYGGFPTNYVNYQYRLLDSSKTEISGTSGTFGAIGWHSLTILGSPRYLEIFCTSGDDRRHRLYAIEVNGTVLENGSFANADSLLDSPTDYEASSGNNGGNYCTLNPLRSATTLSNGNLDSAGGSGWSGTAGTFGMSSGKWYFEYDNVVGTEHIIGIVPATTLTLNTGSSYGYGSETGGKYSPSASNVSYGNSWGAGDVIGVAFDADNGDLYFYKNGTVQNSGTAAFTGLTSGPYLPSIVQNGSSRSASLNFGQRPFGFTPPTGYKSLCTQNLDDTLIADGSTAMDVVTYTGTTQSPRTITGLSFDPDFVWVKNRDISSGHYLWDSVRGTDKNLRSDDTFAESAVSSASNGIISTNATNGFVVKNGSNSGSNVGSSGSDAYVAWTWLAGTSNTTVAVNAYGSGLPGAACEYRANTTAGFSIVKVADPTATSARVHGLGKKPDLILCKSLASADSWHSYHTSLTYTHYINLNTSAAAVDNKQFGEQEPTSTYFYVKPNTGSGANKADGMIYYIWTSVEGYSAFGEYDATQPFVYLGFSPRFLLLKDRDVSEVWCLHDSEREPINPNNARLEPDTTDDEATASTIDIDFLSNGFKIRGGGSTINGHIIYAAFAEHPFKNARAR